MSDPDPHIMTVIEELTALAAEGRIDHLVVSAQVHFKGRDDEVFIARAESAGFETPRTIVCAGLHDYGRSQLMSQMVHFAVGGQDE